MAESVDRDVARLAPALRSIGAALEVIAIIGAIAGVILGIVFAATSANTTTIDALGNASPATTHPYIAVGIAIAVQAVIGGLFVWAVGRAVRLYAIDVAGRHGVDLDNLRTPTDVADRDEFKSDGTF
jgi:hypothetical protein